MVRSAKSLLTAIAFGALGLIPAACTGTNAGDALQTPDEYVEDLFNTGRWKQLERPADNEVELVTIEHVVSFPNGQTTLDQAERQRVVGFLRQSHINGQDRVTLHGPRRDFGRHDPVTAARLDYLRGELSTFGLTSSIADEERLSPKDQEHLAILVTRAVVISPDCTQAQPAPGNRPKPIIGCSTNNNLGLMVADPLDLEQGRPMGPADGEAAALSIDRYRTGEITPLDESATSTTTAP